jgi:hypothetical protein
MRELTKSIGSFSWAMSLFGARQMLNALQPSRATDAFDTVTRETESQLGDALRATFQSGDRIQRSLVDLTFGMVGLGALDPGRWGQTASQMAGGAAEAMAATGRLAGQAVSAAGAAAGQAPGFGAAAAGIARPRVPPPSGAAAASGAPRAAGAPGWGPTG